MVKKFSSRTVKIGCILLAVCGILYSQNVTAAHTFRETTVCARAEWVFHLSLHSIWNNDSASETIKKIPQEKLYKLEEVVEFIGAEPMQDMHSITLYGPSDNH